MKSTNSTVSTANLYKLDGKIPVTQAIPFGLQHILAMFVANISPILIVAGACNLSASQTAMLIQSAMIIAGIGTLIQLFPIWRIGSGLPIVMVWVSVLHLFPFSATSDLRMAITQLSVRFWSVVLSRVYLVFLLNTGLSLSHQL